jgi:drug/metabolite transporter (DMT)-like permease
VKDLPRADAALLPALFVLLWSSGFYACKAGIAHSSATGFLLWRFGLAAALAALVAVAMRAPWPQRPAQYAHLALVGILIHGTYLGPNFYAASQGLPVGLTALIGALQPLLTALAANRLFGERVTGRQWIGLALGLVGILMVLEDKIAFDWSRPLELGLVVVGLFSLTAGTLYQRRFCGFQDLRTGAAVQLAAAALVILLASAWLVPYRVDWQPGFVWGLAWLVVLSVVMYALMHVLFLRGSAARVASLFYLVPPITSLVLWLGFDERLGPLALAGMAVTVAGVALAARR